MSLKRKRSFADASPFSTSSNTSSEQRDSSYSPSPTPQILSFPANWPDPTPMVSRHTSWPKPQLYSKSLAGELDSRTWKRWRDNRPAEEIIHENTLYKLFEAQRVRPLISPLPNNFAMPQQAESSTSNQALMSTQTSLHAFWNLPNPPLSLQGQMISPDLQMRTQRNPDKCEDCDAPLVNQDDMELDDAFGSGGLECQRCRKRVCDLCTVTRESRLCLGCI